MVAFKSLAAFALLAVFAQASQHFERAPKAAAPKATKTSSTHIAGSGNKVGACGVKYTAASHGACVDKVANCGKYIYAHTENKAGVRKNTIAQVVDVCDGFKATQVYFTMDSFNELGGNAKKNSTITNVYWQYVA